LRPTRDANGRWRKGYCPNPKGRPKKRRPKNFDLCDLEVFGNTLIDVVSGGEKVTMIRRAALLHKMFESAMKGKVSQQRFLYKEFERNSMRLAEARVRYEQLMIEWVVENPDFKGLDDESVPLAVQTEILGLQSLLHHYYPTSYQALPGFSESEDYEE
jgi:hypothetical protein